MGLFDERFERWEADDFAAFEERKWASRRFNLERGKVRRRLIDLMRQAESVSGLDVEGLAIWTSPDHPRLSNGHKVQWQAAAWCRDSKLRRAIEQVDPSLDADDVRTAHAHLGVVVEEAVLRVLLVLPAAARLDQGRWEAGAAAWIEVADALGLPIQDDERGRRIEWQLPAQELLGGSGSVGEIAAWLSKALPALRAVQWLPYDDPEGEGAAVLEALQKPAKPAPTPTKKTPPAKDDVAIAPAGSKTEEDKPPPRKPYRPAGRPRRDAGSGDDNRQAQRDGPRNRRSDGNRRTDDNRRADGNRRDDSNRGSDGNRRNDSNRGDRRDRPGDRRDRRDDRPRRPRGDRDNRRNAGPRRPYELGPTRDEAKVPKGTIAVGAKVALRAGLFAGKEGEVVGISKGQAEVAVGMMKVQVAIKDLAPV